MPGLIGWPELILILVIVVFIFGAGRITELARAVGDSVREYKKATSDTTPSQPSKDDIIKDAAAKMGISTEGKTTNQLMEEMNKQGK
jgi:sec-independent protein translocase protein TatA